MGTIIEFPADAASRRPGPTMDGAPRDGLGTVLILPVVRIERQVAWKDRVKKKYLRPATDVAPLA